MSLPFFTQGNRHGSLVFKVGFVPHKEDHEVIVRLLKMFEPSVQVLKAWFRIDTVDKDGNLDAPDEQVSQLLSLALASNVPDYNLQRSDHAVIFHLHNS